MASHFFIFGVANGGLGQHWQVTFLIFEVASAGPGQHWQVTFSFFEVASAGPGQHWQVTFHFLGGAPHPAEGRLGGVPHPAEGGVWRDKDVLTCFDKTRGGAGAELDSGGGGSGKRGMEIFRSPSQAL